MKTMPEWPAWLVAGYRVELREGLERREVVLTCKACSKQWAMAPHGLENPNNALFLLDHAKGHERKR